MRYQSIPSSLFIKNRAKLARLMKPNSVAVLNANDIITTNSDGAKPFRQNSDLFYLSGVDQEESKLVIFPDAHRKEHREMLFLRPTSPQIRLWEGDKLTVEQAQKLTGIENVMWLDDFEKIFKVVACESEHIYLNTNEHLRAKVEIKTRDDRFREWCKAQYPLHEYERLAPLMHRLRSVKEPEEIVMMQKACDITNAAFRRLLGFIKPGVKENEIEAELWHEFVRSGSRCPAYDPIIASGPNACILHYIENDKVCQDGDVILMDFGAEYGNYAADTTRCVPVNGRFSKRQKEVYNAVLHVMQTSRTYLKPGVFLDDYHKQVGALMTETLLSLGLITKEEVKSENPAWPAYKKYFAHGTSHYIGLDVHDVGMWHEPIQAGNVFTVEPGIYILEEGLGIRLEDDILITTDGQVNLMEDIPLEVEEIEDLMNA